MDTSNIPSSEIIPGEQVSLFSVPSLAFANLMLIPLHLDENLEALPPWYGWVDQATVALLLDTLTPLFRSLELAGYVSNLVEFGIVGSDLSAPSGWVRVFFESMTILFSPVSILTEEGDVSDPWTTSDRFVIHVRLYRRNAAGNEELSLEVSEQYSIGNYLVFASQVRPTQVSDLTTAFLDSGIDNFLLDVLSALQARWNSAQQSATLDPFNFTQAPGLLWMFDPTFWETDPPTWNTLEGAWIREIAGHVRDLISLDPLTFFKLQTGFESPLWSKEARLRALLEQAPELRGKLAPQYTLAFFRILHDRNEELGCPLNEDSFSNIAGFSYEQYDSPIRYLDLLMHIAQARLFPFPAIPDLDEPFPYDFEEDPIEVHSVFDPLTAVMISVEISVFDQPPLRIVQEVYLGYPIESCCCWEYREPDIYGKSRLLIVATPGIRIEDRENIPSTCNLTIYRVQDFQSIPAWGEHINEVFYLAPADREALYALHIGYYDDLPYDQEQRDDPTDDPVELPPADNTTGLPTLPAFHVRGVETGVRITYPAADPEDDALFVLDIIVSSDSPDDRFGYDIQPLEGTSGDYQRYGVFVWATPNVEIHVVHKPDSISRVTSLYWRVPSLAYILPTGSSLPILVDDLPAWVTPVEDGDPHFSNNLNVDDYWLALALFKFADFIVGFTPVGDALDLGELLASFYTGTDRWGEPYTNFDVAITLAGVFLPIVSRGVLKNASKMLAARTISLDDAQKLLHRLSRADPLEATGMARREIRQLSELEKQITDRKNRAVLKAIFDASELLVEMGEKVSASATRFVVQFGDIVTSRGGAFLDSEIQWYLRKWRDRRLAKGVLENDIDSWLARQIAGAPLKPQLDPSDAAEYANGMDRWIDDLVEWATVNKIDDAVPGSPLDYARGQRTGGPHLRLQLYLGEHYRDFLRGRTPDPRIAPLQRNRWPRLVKRIWPSPGSNAINDLLQTLTSRQQLVQGVQDVAAKTRVALDRFDAEKTADLIEAIVERYKQNGVLDASGVRKLIGRKVISQEEFIDRVLAGIDMMADEATALKAPDLYEEVFDIPGIESFIEQVVRKSGYEHGYVFEVFLAMRELMQSVSPENLWMQVYVNGKMGPDIVRVMLENGKAVAARIIQAKSYRNLNELLGAGGVGEIKRQLLSDLYRIVGDGFQVTGPGGVRLPVDELIEFKIDWLRLRITEFIIDGIDPEDLRSFDPTVAAKARQAFFDQIVKPRIDEINAWMKTEAFKIELGLDPEDWIPDFTLVVELVDPT